MTWEQKVQMCHLCNCGDQQKFIEFVNPLLNDMDEQAEDMFISGVVVTKDNISTNMSFFEKIINNSEINNFNHGVITLIRMQMIKLIFKEIKSKI